MPEAVNQRIVFEGFPSVIFGDHILPEYDQMVQVNKEDELDLVTDVDHLVNLEHAFQGLLPASSFVATKRRHECIWHMCAKGRTNAVPQQQSPAGVRLTQIL